MIVDFSTISAVTMTLLLTDSIILGYLPLKVDSQAQIPDPLENYVTEWSGHLTHGLECKEQSEIEKIQRNQPLTSGKAKQIDEMSCVFERFLSCYVNPNRTADEIRRHVGTCECHDATGGVRWGILDSVGICGIPADRGLNSACGRNNNKIARQLYTKKTMEANCTENSECVPNVLHIGRRCYCKIGFQSVDGRCNLTWQSVQVNASLIFLAMMLTSIRI